MHTCMHTCIDDEFCIMINVYACIAIKHRTLIVYMHVCWCIMRWYMHHAWHKVYVTMKHVHHHRSMKVMNDVSTMIKFLSCVSSMMQRVQWNFFDVSKNYYARGQKKGRKSAKNRFFVLGQSALLDKTLPREFTGVGIYGRPVRLQTLPRTFGEIWLKKWSIGDSGFRL